MILCVSVYIQREGRAHFGYPEMKGVELENQGGEGTALQHWEKRLLGVCPSLSNHTQTTPPHLPE